MTCRTAEALFFLGAGVLLGLPLLFSLYFVLVRVTQPKAPTLRSVRFEKDET